MARIENVRNTAITVGTSPVVLSEEQYEEVAMRSVIIITNTSTGGQKITISVGDDPIAGNGILLGAGGFYQDSMESGYIPSQKRIIAISDLAGGTVAIHERVLSRGIGK